MNRRELIKMIAAATGAAFVGGNVLLAGCTRREPAEEYLFSSTDILLLDEVAETIIPRTDTPGAKDAQVGQFMTVMVNDCYTAEDQLVFHRGITQLQDFSRESYGAAFMELTREDRHDLLAQLDREARLHNAGQNGPHYFTMMKQLTLFGFFTSKVGATEVLRYTAVPGRFDGCIPYTEGDRAWAT
ncbi:gluconate 2-dehydrogenase subunit 3 family protein [Microbulbifer harenosus]|uniref:Gluconate 2-dehydrogenase subunit 3 family protein n=1 Tax=Microbulbifer harenosus TaxID=2576840 RepID=A0ABY2UEF7_9GAMM|nr:gluconate 2-dehydrogenase subunit 3 family protein [Microbulbifer harenosus]TLM75236.1 gluconate 2-dehydrogenase subunit 3 family protein [Microbulbifer harenosus]